MSILEEHARKWGELATTEEQRGAWDRERGYGDGAVQARKAAIYRRTAQALRLEATTGRAHCSCCLLPRVDDEILGTCRRTR